MGDKHDLDLLSIFDGLLNCSVLAESAKIAGEIVRHQNIKGRTIRSLSFHSLRHSFNSEMANAGVGEELRMKLTGHATREEHKKYTHHELAPLRAAINKIPPLGG
jgi:integrase